jgi:hypothetical protein
MRSHLCGMQSPNRPSICVHRMRYYAQLQASTAKYLRNALFWVITQRVLRTYNFSRITVQTFKKFYVGIFTTN